MGAELGATTTVFPVRRRDSPLPGSRRPGRRLVRIRSRTDGCSYDEDDADRSVEARAADRDAFEPGNVVRVARFEGDRNLPGLYRIVGQSRLARLCRCRRNRSRQAVPAKVSFDVNPTSRRLLEMLIADGRLGALVAAGARIHQTGCNGCIGMGQAPAIGQNSLRTTPRNFPGRSGTERGFGLPVLAGDRGGFGAHGPDHRSRGRSP